MVDGLAEQLGGTFALSSQLGAGTVATMLLPVSAPPLGVIEETQSEEAQPRAATVLVVEDDLLIAMSTVAMLEDLGHTTIEANSGRKALEILKGEQTIDLMITDHAMPNMTGIELAQMARRIRPSMPILLATGYVDVAAAAESDLPRLSKPYHQEQLQAAIAQVLLSSREALAEWDVGVDCGSHAL